MNRLAQRVVVVVAEPELRPHRLSLEPRQPDAAALDDARRADGEEHAAWPDSNSCSPFSSRARSSSGISLSTFHISPAPAALPSTDSSQPTLVLVNAAAGSTRLVGVQAETHGQPPLALRLKKAARSPFFFFFAASCSLLLHVERAVALGRVEDED